MTGRQHLVEPVHHRKRKAGRAAHSGEKKSTAFTPEDVTRNGSRRQLCLPVSDLPDSSEGQLLEDLMIILQAISLVSICQLRQDALGRQAQTVHFLSYSLKVLVSFSANPGQGL